MKIQFTALFLIIGLFLRAQPDLSGAYGYSYAPLGNPPETEMAKGASGTLILLRMDGNKYRFWPDVTIGWPSYNRGETDGTVTILNDTASFDNSYEEAASPCILKFRIQKTSVLLNSQSTSFNCGFGVSVNADGEYKRLAEQPRLDNDWLKKMYGQSPQATISVNKAELF